MLSKGGFSIAVILVLGILCVASLSAASGWPAATEPWETVQPTESLADINEMGVEPLMISTSAPSPQGHGGFLVAQGGESSHSATSTVEGPSPTKLGISVTGAWASKYMFKGFKILDSGVYLHDVDMNLWDTGFHFKFQGAAPSHDRGKRLLAGRVPPWLEEAVEGRGISFDRSDIDEFIYNLTWKKDICEGFNLEVGGNYYDMYGLNSQKADFLETYGILTLSNLPLSPHFGAYYAWPYNDDHKGEGWMTDMGITKPFPIPACQALGTPATALVLSADLWYNGGAWSRRVDTGWAYAEFKAMVPIPLPQHMMLIPGVTYQLSLDDTVDEEDEIYASVALQYRW